MWPIFVEFRSANLEGSWRKKKKERKKERIPVKPWSADRHVGRPNKHPIAYKAQLAWKCLFTPTFFPQALLTRKVAQTDLVLVCDEGSWVGLHMQDYKSLCASLVHQNWIFTFWSLWPRKVRQTGVNLSLVHLRQMHQWCKFGDHRSVACRDNA